MATGSALRVGVCVFDDAEDGSVHYSARYGAAKDTSGFGVLYADKDKINLAPLMLNGAPGYPFKVGSR